MLLSGVSVLVVAQSSSEIPEGLMNNPADEWTRIMNIHRATYRGKTLCTLLSETSFHVVRGVVSQLELDEMSLEFVHGVSSRISTRLTTKDCSSSSENTQMLLILRHKYECLITIWNDELFTLWWNWFPSLTLLGLWASCLSSMRCGSMWAPFALILL